MTDPLSTIRQALELRARIPGPDRGPGNELFDAALAACDALEAERNEAWNHCSTCGEMSGGGAYGCEECSEFLSEAGLTDKADVDRLEAERLTPEEARLAVALFGDVKIGPYAALKVKLERRAGEKPTSIRAMIDRESIPGGRCNDPLCCRGHE